MENRKRWFWFQGFSWGECEAVEGGWLLFLRREVGKIEGDERRVCLLGNTLI